MAEYATDIIEQSDIIAATGAASYRVEIASHATLTGAQRAILRTAALSGWSALRTAWIGIDDRAGAWLDTLDTPGRDAMIRTLSRALLPA